MKLYLQLVLLMSGIYGGSILSQVGIMTNAPAQSAALHIHSPNANKGFLPPRVFLPNTASSTPDIITGGAPKQSLLVYNTNDQITGTGAAGEGYYYWDINIWRKLATTTELLANTWMLAGNANISGSNFLGTTDDQPVIIKTDNKRVMTMSVAGTSPRDEGALGIGVTQPDHKLDVDAAGNGTYSGIRFTNLPAASGAFNSVNVDAVSGKITSSAITNVASQVLRIGLQAAYSYLPGLGDQPIRSVGVNDDAGMGNAPNGAPNFVNTITGCSITNNVPLSAASGVTGRTADVITLPNGTYRVTLRLAGSFSNNTQVSQVEFKLMVNNAVYADCVGIMNKSVSSSTSAVYSEILNLNNVSNSNAIDFTLNPNFSSFTLSSFVPQGSGKSFRSILFIERLL